MAALFILITPLIIMYSQGYRFDLRYGAIIKTGALFLEPRPAPVGAYFDGKLKKQSNFVFQNIYIGNLFPRSYLIEVKKDGYFSWGKKLTVLPKLVTEAKNIYLFPKNVVPKILASNLAEFYPSPDNERIAIVETNPILNIHIYEKRTDKKSLLYQDSATSTNFEATAIVWSPDSSKVALLLNGISRARLIIKELKGYTSYELRISQARILKIAWNPLDTDDIIFTAANEKFNLLLKHSTKNRKLPQTLAHDVSSFTINDNNIIYISTVTQTKSLLDLQTGDIRQLTFHPADDRETDKVFTPDRKKFLVIEENDIWVQWLENNHTQPFRDTGDTIKVVRNDSPVFDAIWFTKNNEYIIFSEEEAIKIIELDTRDRQNLYKIISMRAQKLSYDDTRNTLYFLSGGSLYAAELK